ncbi:integral membrane protein pth11 [Purpureocillium lavendulum]|uniref:Integral membrane protein pth11 n=1 Tax=Purpureocillium lavendulum TaxID=1247861 RepID=A0AB34FVU1_9HYPO|nr:integral membrane protein pth11 [Purpureocillium lavendulum]
MHVDDDQWAEYLVSSGHVPPGVTAKDLRANYEAPSIVIIGLFTVLAILAVALRLISRRYVIKRFGVGLDDGLALASLATLMPFVASCLYIIALGMARHPEFMAFFGTEAQFVTIEVTDTAAHLIYSTSLWLCRISGLAFYYRMCSLHQEFLVCIKVFFGLLTVGFVAQVLVVFFHCWPLSLLWRPYPGIYKCMEWTTVAVIVSAISLACDLLLFGIPAAMLWVLKSSRKKKIQLACILLPGVFVTGISVARVVLVVWDGRATAQEYTFTFLKILCVEVAEISATLITLSIPGIKPMFDKYILRKDIDGTVSGRNSPAMERQDTAQKNPALNEWMD